MISTLRTAVFVSLAVVAPAYAQSGIKQITTIAIPGNPMDNFDVGFVDQNAHLYFLADRTNAVVHVIDTQTNKVVGEMGAGSFTGPKSGGVGGPNGLVVFGGKAWVSDGDSTVKIFDEKTDKLVGTVSTGGQKRADESAYDPKDKILAVVNGADDPPFVTFVSAESDHKILGKLPFEHATDGIEQPVYDPATGAFYFPVPELDRNKGLGAIVQVDPKTFKIVKSMNIEDCDPKGFVVGSSGNLAIGCGDVKKAATSAVLDPKTGEFTRIPGVGGGDEIAYNAVAQQYYITGSNMPGGPVFGIIDAKTNKWIENISVVGRAHSIATENSSKHIFVPLEAGNGPCNGCVGVYGPQ